ncbi:MFS general substrate transporter [Basidiobolus meristosporus CBS 931.73]|uniref:MFS general substrate transporter n=1 Tax=Basidiobolus meristosporus CBS 931.73 TaxID=1314790 RepID=A0A1Y1XYC8_9FUNG|nr:MFS general substrate transporter [Basidiobolus meristosporus CBS 931.73]|eukprot:ORX90486.1 MFS general substrate transporter [Basidiobolus meristosporus CBS 931.73]
MPKPSEEKKDFTLKNEEVPLPDGGYGWFVVLSSFLIHFVTLGISYTFGVYQTFYYNDLFQHKVKMSTLSLVGTFATSFMTIFGIFTGHLADRYGYRVISFVGCFFVGGGLIAASFATQPWHLYLTQGLMYGIGASLCFCPAVSLPSQWFVKYRGLATGIAVAGAGVGGLSLSPITRKLIDVVGYQWTLRIIGMCAFVILAIASALLKTRLQLPPRGVLIDLSLFKQRYFQLLFSGALVLSIGYMIPFFHVSNYAVFKGMTASQGALITGFINGASAVGRVVLGLVADKVGRINAISFCVLLDSLIILVFWPFATTFSSVFAFAILYGFFGGGYISMLPVVSAELFGIEKIATTIGLVYASTGFGYLIGIPVGGVIVDHSRPRNTCALDISKSETDLATQV